MYTPDCKCLLYIVCATVHARRLVFCRKHDRFVGHRMPSPKHLLWIVLGARCYSAAFPPYSWSILGWIALAPLFLVIRHQTVRSPFVSGVLYALLWCCGIGYWVYGTVVSHFPLAFPSDVLFVQGNFLVYAGLPVGLVTAGSCFLMRRAHPWTCRLGIPALWVGGELLRAHQAFGVAWGLLGYSQHAQLPLIQVAALTGVYGLSFLMAFSSYVIAECDSVLSQGLTHIGEARSPESRPLFLWTSLSIGATSIFLVWLYGTHQFAHPPPMTSPSVTVATVRTAVPPEHMWKRTHYARNLSRYATATQDGMRERLEKRETLPDLIIWPEFALQFSLNKEIALRAQPSRFVQHLGIHLLFGAPRLEIEKAANPSYNSAYLGANNTTLDTMYAKIRLVPFAEYQPFSLPTLFAHTPDTPTTFTPGQEATIFHLLTSKFGTMICYEATYPGFARQLVQKGAPFLVNISNDTWLGGSQAAREQHFSMAVFRAVETRRSLVRTATAGISVFIDPYGRVRQLSSTRSGTTLGQLIPFTYQTIYTRYGDWFAWSCVGFASLTFLVVRWKDSVHRPAKTS